MNNPALSLSAPLTLAARFLGNGVPAFFVHIGRLGLFFLRTLRACLAFRWPRGEFINQMVEVGLDSLPVLAGVSLFIGMSVALEGYSVFSRFGGENMIGAFVGMSLLRELCPAIAAGILTAKAGTRIAAALGLMRIKQQIDALEVMAVDPMSYLVAPRFLAMLLMIPCLILVSDVTALLAGFAVNTWQLGLDPGAFMRYLQDFVSFQDILNGMVKGLFFGAVIATLACYFGFGAEQGPEGVGRATNRTVVYSGVLTIIVNLILTDIMYR